MALLLVLCSVLSRAGAGVDSQVNSTVAPLHPPPQVTVSLKVVKENDTQYDRDVGEGSTVGLGSDSLPLPSPPQASPIPDAPSKHLPLPIVTVASRLLYSPGRKERERDSNSARDAFVGGVPRHKIDFAPVPEGSAYLTDKTLAQSSVLAWAGSFVSLLQPSSVPLGGYASWCSPGLIYVA